MGKASGINYMAQRLGGVFAIAISTAVFAANGDLGTPARKNPQAAGAVLLERARATSSGVAFCFS
jgi:hypothetical protein